MSAPFPCPKCGRETRSRGIWESYPDCKTEYRRRMCVGGFLCGYRFVTIKTSTIDELHNWVEGEETFFVAVSGRKPKADNLADARVVIALLWEEYSKRFTYYTVKIEDRCSAILDAARSATPADPYVTPPQDLETVVMRLLDSIEKEIAER